MAQELTTRQAEIKTRLDEGQGAREIADGLGITRNAVYQQITAMKKKGLISPEYTPTGEVRTPAPMGDSRLAIPVTGSAPMQVIAELVEMNRKLVDLVAELQAERRTG